MEMSIVDLHIVVCYWRLLALSGVISSADDCIGSSTCQNCPRTVRDATAATLIDCKSPRVPYT